MTATALLDPTPPEEDKETVEEIFKGLEEAFGMVPDGAILYGISPSLLKPFIDSFNYLVGHEHLSQKLLGLIRYLNSTSVECPYCIDFNAGFLIGQGMSPEELRATTEDIDKAPLSDAERSLLAFAMSALKNPDAISAVQVQRLRELGFSDQSLFDAVFAAASNRAFTTLLKTFEVNKQGESFPVNQPAVA